MRQEHFKTIVLAIVVVAGGGLLGTVGLCGSSEAQPRPPLSPELERLARFLETLPDTRDDGDVPPPSERADPGAPVNALRDALEVLADLRVLATPRAKHSVEAAHAAVEGAWQAFSEGSPDLGHLGRTADALGRAQVHLGIAALLGGPDTKKRVKAVQDALAGVGARMAADLIAAAESAGVPRPRLLVPRRLLDFGLRARDSSLYAVAQVNFGGATKRAANTVTFDVELFRQNIVAALAGVTVGHAFSIAYLGQLYQDGDSVGLARTTADPPSVAQSPAKEMHVASVSKTLTTLVTLRLLQENGLTPDTLIAPYLPSDWVLGTGVDLLTFRHFLTHTSGFGQNNVGNTYAELQAGIGLDVGATTWSYKNANFGLMRVLVSGLLGLDPVDYPLLGAGAFTTAVFLLEAQSLYSPIGVNIDCTPTDPDPTVQYNFPDDGAPGYVEPNRQLQCGGFGWFISSNELANVMANLRLTENLNLVRFSDGDAAGVPRILRSGELRLGGRRLRGLLHARRRLEQRPRGAPLVRGRLPDPGPGRARHQLGTRCDALPM